MAIAYRLTTNTMAKSDKKNTAVSSKEQFKLEYLVRASPKIIYNMLVSPSGLSEWFCDDVNIRNDEYTFKWEDSKEKANLIGNKENVMARFKWQDDDEDGVYFEFKIEVDELTNDVALIITDFAEKHEKDSRMLFWNNQIHKLMHAVGS